MSRKLFRILIVVLLLFVGWGASNRSQASLSTPANSPAVAKKVTVEVTFDGLMVFRKVKGHFGAADHYEVGVLDKDTAPGHVFTVIVGEHELLRSKKTTEMLGPGSNWSLNVITASGRPKDPDIKARHPNSCNRWQDTMADEDLDHVFDFCWIMDLEKEFNGGHQFKLRKGKLKPIILLNNGELYTKFKYDQLSRQPRKLDPRTGRPQSSGEPSNFGFVAETIALRVELEPGEKLVLSNAGNQSFTLEQNGEHHAGFYNGPPQTKYHRDREDSHFPYYYDLFEKEANVLGDDIKVTPGGRRPLNRFYQGLRSRSLDDKLKKATFDRQTCGASFLGESNDPLE